MAVSLVLGFLLLLPLVLGLLVLLLLIVIVFCGSGLGDGCNEGLVELLARWTLCTVWATFEFQYSTYVIPYTVMLTNSWFSSSHGRWLFLVIVRLVVAALVLLLESFSMLLTKLYSLLRSTYVQPVLLGSSLPIDRLSVCYLLLLVLLP